MIDIRSKRCIYDKCQTIPSYGNPDDKKAIYCKSHALDGMIDIRSKRCIYNGCRTLPVYGNPDDKKAAYCKSHALEGMIDIRSKRCIYDKCQRHPTYNYSNKTVRLYCKSHALEGMIDISHKRCETCDTARINRKYKPNCARCHFYLNPDDPRIRNFKVKEHAFMLPLKELYPDMILDKVIQGGCSKRRPDGLLDLYSHVIIVEIDEDQHTGYDNMCDNRRTMELYTDLGNRPIIFIRLNPDSYKLHEKRHKGCFSLNKSGELSLNKSEFKKRYESLLNAIESSYNVIPSRSITMIELYYSDE